MRRFRRQAPYLPGLLAALLAVAGCSSNSESNSNYAALFQMMRQSIAGTFGNGRVTLAQASAIPYASLGYRIEGGNEAILVLATETSGDQLWTSAAHIVLVTRGGRIVRSLGLSHDLTATSGAQVPTIASALAAPFSSTRLVDFPDLQRYGETLACHAVARAHQRIKILGQAIATMRVDETCESRALGWSFTDIYWVDVTSGLVWRARQHLHPKGGQIEIEMLRPPG